MKKVIFIFLLISNNLISQNWIKDSLQQIEFVNFYELKSNLYDIKINDIKDDKIYFEYLILDKKEIRKKKLKNIIFKYEQFYKYFNFR